MKNITYISIILLVVMPALLFSQSIDKNFVKTSTVKKEAVTNPDSVNIGNAHQNVQYFDGIGRPNQVVQIQTTPNQTDLVQVIHYDDLGRETVNYLPYAVAVGLGNFDPDWQTAQSGYYANPPDDVDSSSYPFAVKAWDNSPLNRLMKQGAPGVDWQLSEHPVVFDYQTNLADQVPLLTWNIDSNTYADEGFYAAGKLFITQTTDENGSVTNEYKNFNGQVVLKTSYLGTQQLSTYYIYDDFNDLVCVIPPEAYKKLREGGFDSEPEVPVIPPPNPPSTLLDNLISCWEFDETSGTTANDVHGSNDGTVNGATVNLPGKLDKCFNYDGVDNVSIPSSNLNQLPITISSWFYSTSEETSNEAIVNKYISGSYNGYSLFYYPSSKTVYGWYFKDHYNHVGLDYLLEYTFPDNNQWNHVVLIFDNNGGKLYVNGELKVSRPWIGNSGVCTTTTPLLIGRYTGSFQGYIDQTAIWNRALTEEEITELYNNGDGKAYPFDGAVPEPEPELSTLMNNLVSLWEFNETSGTIANDVHGSNDGTVNGATVNLPGKLDKCFNYDGVDNVSIPSSNLNQLPITISSWFYSTSEETSNEAIVNKYISGSYNGYSLFYYPSSKTVYGWYFKDHYNHVGLDYLLEYTFPDNNQWNHVVLIFDNNGGKLYVNGELRVTRPWIGNAGVCTTTTPLLIGRYTSSFQGYIDQSAIWNRALTADEITELYNNGDGFAYPFEHEQPPSQTTYLPDSTLFNDQVYTYKYDHRNRMVEKKIPGQKEVYMVYDKLDRLVATQDAKMREENKWLFTKYDAFSRPVETGTYQNRTDTSQGDMQILVNTEPDLFETFNTSTKTYSCVAFPVADSITEYLTYNYYDNYTFIPTTKSYLEYTEPCDTDFGDNAFLLPKGLLTGSKSKILDNTGNYLFTVNYYDDKDRIVQSKTEHAKDGYDISNFLYDFLGNPEMTNLEHSIDINGSPTSDTMKWWYYYDHASRLTDVKHQVNSQTAQWIVRNGYNDLGQLIEKDLHAKSNNDTTLGYQQSVAYSYNIRGWLKKMNSANLTTNDNALFGMELFYNEGLGELGGQATYNGNISGMKWVVNDKTTAPMRAYGFNYDSINRISLANYGDNTGDAFTANNRYSVSGLNGSAIDYDLNGNIQHLWRQGENTGTTSYSYGFIDQLAYSYIGNTLIAVNDTIADFAANNFKDGTSNGTLEYAYDVNGNMIRDDNKGIINIVYNYLNLPEEINFGGGNKIIYLYSADGYKLKKMVYTNNLLTSTKIYAGSFVYNNNALEYALFDEGRLLESGGVFEYQYFLKDHLGNTRVTFSGNTGLIQQQDHYYPFGMNFAGINTTAASTENFYRYNGKELQKDLDLNWYDYGARFYDPQVPHFLTIDPLAEKYAFQSPYIYAANNPIRFIDRMGMAPDGYTIDDENNIERVDNTGGNEYDVLYTKADYLKAKQYTKETGNKNEYGNPEPVDQVRVSKGTMNEMVDSKRRITHPIVDYGGSYTGKTIYSTSYKLTSDKDATKLMGFLDKKFDVEWSNTLIENKNGSQMNLLVTSNEPGTITQETEHTNRYGGQFLRSDHIHPNGDPTPSKWYGDWGHGRDILKHSQNTKFRILTKGKYYPYTIPKVK